MRRAYVALGKYGDLCSILPILQRESELSGEPQNLVVSRDYAHALCRAKFVKRVPYNGDFADLAGAIRFAKQRFDEVIVAQVYGKDFPFRKLTPSFQLDQWLRAGYLDKWDTIRLELARPHFGHHIVKRYIGDSRAILFGDHGQSSPFPHREEMAQMLQKEFGATHKIVRLSEVHLKNPMDMLALYDAAELLVSVETLHLHLSAASGINVIALVTDKPERWHGTAYQKRFRFSCRYGEFQLRKEEIMQAAREAIAGVAPLQVETMPTHYQHGYNPAIIDWRGSRLMVYRYHPDGAGKTMLAIKSGENTSIVSIPIEQGYSHEDPRLFVYQGRLHLSYTISMWPTHPNCIVGYGELLPDGAGWKIEKHNQIKYGNNDFSGMVKNLVFFESDGRLFCIWGTRGSQQIVLQIDGEKVVAEHAAPEPVWGFGAIRGGVAAPHNGHLLRLFHSRTEPTKNMLDWRYSIGAALMESRPPFNTLAVSKTPILSGNEKFTPRCKHWKANVAIPYGMIDNGNSFSVSVGLNDCECALLNLPKERLRL